MAGLTALSSLAGRWQTDRWIAHDNGQVDTFEGVTKFHLAGHRLIQDEDGYLTAGPEAQRLRATRRYLWTKDRGRLECAFADNRPFHSVPLGATRPETTYLCPPDRYSVAYDFSKLPVWSSTWTVEGPKKHYVMTTTYRRLSES